MTKELPQFADIEWLKKSAKRLLKDWRAEGRDAKLADAQFFIAKDYGFASWRALKAQLESAASDSAVYPSDPDTFLRNAGTGETDLVVAALQSRPDLVNVVGRHPFWGGRLQALHLTIEGGNRALFDLLLEHGADAQGNNGGYDNWSPLMLALMQGRPEMAERLEALGAERGLCETLLAADDTRLDGFLQNDAWRTLPSPSGSLLGLARTPYAVHRLSDAGVSPHDKDRWGSDAMDALTRLGKAGKPLAAALAEHGQPLSAVAHARFGDLDRLKAISLQDPSAVTDHCLLMAAVDFGHVEVADWLLKNGADVQAHHTIGSEGTALHSAAWNGDHVMVECLLSHGADLEAIDAEYRTTPLVWAQTSLTVTRNPDCDAVAALLASHMESAA